MIRRNKPLRKMSKRRQAESKEYMHKRAIFLAEHPVCQLWCAENGWTQVGGVYAQGIGEHERFRSAQELIIRYGAPESSEVHHKNGRNGKNYLDEKTWMACCTAGHRKIEANKSWARANGYLGKK